MANAETIQKADGFMADVIKTVDVGVDEIAYTASKILEKAAQKTELSVDDRAMVKRGYALAKCAKNLGDDATSAPVDVDLWTDVQKDTEGVSMGKTPPSVKVAQIAKMWTPLAEVAPAPAPAPAPALQTEIAATAPTVAKGTDPSVPPQSPAPPIKPIADIWSPDLNS